MKSPPLPLGDSSQRAAPTAGVACTVDGCEAVERETSFDFAPVKAVLSCPADAEFPREFPGQRGAEMATALGSALVPTAGASTSEQAAAITGGTAAEGCGRGEEGAGGPAEEGEEARRARAVPDGAGVDPSAACAAPASRLAALRSACLAFFLSFFLWLLVMLLPPPPPLLPLAVALEPLAEDLASEDVESGRSEATTAAREWPSTPFVLDEDRVE